MAQVGAGCPALDAGFVYFTGGALTAGTPRWASPLSREVWNRLGLAVELDCADAEAGARFTYRRDDLSRKAVEELSGLFQRILREVAEDPETRLEDLAVTRDERSLGLTLQDNARQEFHF
jgi:non-ribosomal peptide synthetase component F